LKLAFILLVLFQIKHFLADFPLQFPFMVRRKGLPGWQFLLPLCAHCAIHALFTLLIVLWVDPNYWWLAGADFLIHFVLDRMKAGPFYFGRFSDPNSVSYWTVFGFDQMAHHLTYLWIVWVLIAP
jgi:hypothetical protein